jgi:hypothetical protein
LGIDFALLETRDIEPPLMDNIHIVTDASEDEII